MSRSLSIYLSGPLVAAAFCFNAIPTRAQEETVPRTVERTEDHCTVSAYFRLELINPKAPQPPIDTVLLAKAQPELHLLNDGERLATRRTRTNCTGRNRRSWFDPRGIGEDENY